MVEINDLLELAVARGASDLHIKIGAQPVIRVDGHLTTMIDQKRLTPDDTLHLAFSMMTPGQREKFRKHKQIDLAHAVPGLGRFRVSAFQQRGTVSIVLRVVPTKILGFKELYLPPVMEKLSMENRGLIILTGTTGSGKSTTLAAMIDYMNVHRVEHIVTIEDPIEFLHRDKRCIINQREVGSDTETFAGALRVTLRQDPDVILVGEMRDFETVDLAIAAAETGHLVLTTLHTLDAVETINRIVAFYPPHQQQQIRLELAAIIKGIVSQRLMPKADGKGRIPAVEVLVSTGLIRDKIVDREKTMEIKEAIADGVVQYGMQTFDQCLIKLFYRKLITLDTAMRYCSNPDDFMLKIKGISSTSDMAKAEEAAEIGTDLEQEAMSFDFSNTIDE
ncbi:MAG: type IV pili twitching motility protein PilT [Candidatus Coatesbacteria bacterium]|nr:MAG: type IV pili twitching motility protein PilT [Candidatus Coatesbacteria bacterium]